jgi:integrase
LRTFRTYRPILEDFKASCSKSHIEDVERQDILDFATQCVKQGQKGKTIYNKLVLLSQVMKQYGKDKLLTSSDWPSFVETVRPIYEDDELSALFKAAEFPEEVRFKFYLMSGFRDAEGRFVTWRDVDFKHMAIRVTAKPHWGFHPKNWEEREVPVPQKLIALLERFRPSDGRVRMIPSSPASPAGRTARCSKSSRPSPIARNSTAGIAARFTQTGGWKPSGSTAVLKAPTVRGGFSTNSGTPSRHGISRTASISARSSNGWGIGTSRRRWSI